MFKGDKEGNVTANDKPLKMTNEGRQSSSAFNWGYGGSGPYALAHSMLAHLFGVSKANMWASEFKWDVVMSLTHSEPFKLPYAEVRAWMKEKEMDNGEYADWFYEDAALTRAHYLEKARQMPSHNL